MLRRLSLQKELMLLVMFAGQVAIVLWIATLAVGNMVPLFWWLANWQVLSESLWLLLGMVFVWKFRAEIREIIWQSLVARFGIFTYVVTLIWWLLLLVMMVILMDQAEVQSYWMNQQFTGGPLSSERIVSMGAEALKLYAIGLLPVLGYKFWVSRMVNA